MEKLMEVVDPMKYFAGEYPRRGSFHTAKMYKGGFDIR